MVKIEEATKKIQSLAKIDLKSMEPFLSDELTREFEEIQVDFR